MEWLLFLISLNIQLSYLMSENTNRNSTESCGICFPTSSQIKGIIQSLFQMVSNVNKQQVTRASSNKKPKNCKKQPETFTSLLNFIFRSENTQSKPKSGCEHNRLYQFFCQSISCSQKELNQISHYLFNQNLKRTYQLQIIGDQIKTIEQKNLTKCNELKSQNQIPVMEICNPMHSNINYGVFYNQPHPFVFGSFVTPIMQNQGLSQAYYKGQPSQRI